MLIWFRNMLSKSSSTVCGRTSQSGEVNCAQKLARIRHSPHNNIQHMLAAYLCDRGSRSRQHCVRHVNVLILRILCQSNISLRNVVVVSHHRSPLRSRSSGLLSPRLPLAPENKLENIEKLGRLNIFWIIKYFWSGTFNIFYGAPPLSQLNCNRELETGTGN